MAQKPGPGKPQLLTAAIIAYMKAGEERGDAQCAGLRVRCSTPAYPVSFYRYRARRRAAGDQAGRGRAAHAREGALRCRKEAAGARAGQRPSAREAEGEGAGDARTARAAPGDLHAGASGQRIHRRSAQGPETRRRERPDTAPGPACRCSAAGRRYRSRGASCRTR